MSKKVNSLIAKYLDLNAATLESTREISEAWSKRESESLNIALHRDVGFLITCGLSSSENTPKSKEEINKLLSENIKVVHRNKRSAVFMLGRILLVANRFGVMTFNSRCEHFKGYGSLHLVRCAPLIHELLKSKCDGYDRGDSLYNYQVGL